MFDLRCERGQLWRLPSVDAMEKFWSTNHARALGQEAGLCKLCPFPASLWPESSPPEEAAGSLPATLRAAQGGHVPAAEGALVRAPAASTSECREHALSWYFVIISADRSWYTKHCQLWITFIPAVLHERAERGAVWKNKDLSLIKVVKLNSSQMTKEQGVIGRRFFS